MARNRAAKILRGLLEEAGVGFYPVVDHRDLAHARHRPARPAVRFARLCTMKRCSMTTGTPRSIGRPAIPPCSWIRPIRTPGKTSIIPRWVAAFGDQVFHHVAVRVEDIDRAVARLKSNGWNLPAPSSAPPAGNCAPDFFGTGTREWPAVHGPRAGGAAPGLPGFLPPQADSLMKSTAPQ